MHKVSLSMSKSQIKRLATRNFFEQSKAKPREDGVNFSVAIIMAGVPGAGKTEFVSSLIEKSSVLRESMLRIDLDEIITVFEEYSPEEDYKFRDLGNAIVESVLDKAFSRGYNFILDGTFSSESSLKNVKRAIRNGYSVLIVVLDEDIERAKQYVKIRKEKTKREIKDNVFEEVAEGVRRNIIAVQKEFIDKMQPVTIRAFKKEWTAGNSKGRYMEIPDLDNVYRKR